MFVGGLVLLFVTNAKLSLLVVASVPFVVAPVVIFGRRVRRLSDFDPNITVLEYLRNRERKTGRRN